MNITQATQIAKATQWEGDIRVNFLTMARASISLANALEELMSAVDEVTRSAFPDSDDDWMTVGCPELQNLEVLMMQLKQGEKP